MAKPCEPSAVNRKQNLARLRPSQTSEPSGSSRSSWREVIGSCPLDCPDACSWVVSVDEDGRARKLRGNPNHPFTRGGLCAKVNPWLENAADPARLTEPLRRVGPKGSSRFEPISWDDAIGEMAARFHAIIERSGGAAIWPFAGTGNLGWLQGCNGPDRVWTRMGAAAHHLSICSVSGKAGFSYTTGTGAGLDPEAIVDAGVVVIWASNTLVTNRHLWPFVEAARQRGAKLVVVDPMRTRTAKQADIHVAPQPGTDGALALGVMAAIVDQGGADPDFLANKTLGSEEFLSSLTPWTLERTALVCGVTEAEVEALAAAIVSAPPLAMRIGHGIQRQASGGQAMRIVSCIPAIVGSYGVAGGGALYSATGTPNGFNQAKSKRAELGRRPRTLTMTNLGYNLTELDDPPVDALVVYGANPMVSNPQTGLVQRGLEREDLFTVVIDIYPTETAAYADLVLPSTMQHEQLEINDSYNHVYVNWNEPAVAPPGQCLPHTEMFRRLAAAMGYHERELFASDEELAADLLDSDEWRAAGVSVDSLRSAGFARRPSARPFLPFGAGFPTPSGLFEFTSERAEQDGHGLLPNYRPPAEAARAQGRAQAGQPMTLALVAAASDLYVNSVFAGTELTASKATAPPVILHPEDAECLGIASGATVTVANHRGSFSATVAISDSVRRGVAHCTKGWWQQGINRTVAERDSDMASGATFHDNRVTFTACGS